MAQGPLHGEGHTRELVLSRLVELKPVLYRTHTPGEKNRSIYLCVSGNPDEALRESMKSHFDVEFRDNDAIAIGAGGFGFKIRPDEYAVLKPHAKPDTDFETFTNSVLAVNTMKYAYTQYLGEHKTRPFP